MGLNRAVVLAACAGLACGQSMDWATISPADAGLDPAKIEAWRSSLAAHRTTGLIVIRRGRIALEWYAPEWDANRPHGTASMAKALVGGMSLAVAMSDGRISPDDPASKYIGGWSADPLKSKITIRHLATHTSGVSDAEQDGIPHDQLPGWKGDFWKRTPDPFSIAVRQAPLLFEPGTQYAYSNPGMAALSYAITAALEGGDIRTMLKERVLDPLGVPERHWSIGYGRVYEVDGLNLYANWGGASFTARAAARVGQLMMLQGHWNGRDLIRRDVVKKVLSDQGMPRPSRSATDPAPASGLAWYTNADGIWPAAPRDAFAGAGASHQVIVAAPSLDLIVVRNGDALGDTGSGFWGPVYELVVKPLMEGVTVRAPYPPSSVIRRAVFGKEIRREAIDSDNWPLTWGDDESINPECRALPPTLACPAGRYNPAGGIPSMNRRGFIQAALGAAVTPICASAQEASSRTRTLNLKITGLRTFVVNAGSLNWVFCKVYTNGGLVGLGEGSVTSKEATIAQAIMEHERFLVGKDPTDIELLWQSMFRVPRWRGGPILNSAISAVEIALWDILGQALEVPIYKLLGGAARTRIRMYLDVGSTPEDCLRAKELGYTAVKTTPLSPANNFVNPSTMIRDGVRKLQAIRKAVGDDFDIAVDAHGRCTTAMAIDFCTRVEDLNLLFVEEPTQLEDLGELALLRQKTKTHLATGERSFTKYGFADLCSRHLVDYVQPDVCHAGGILELKKIGVLAETYRVNLAPHNPQSYVSTLASLHVDATTPSAVIQEYTLNRTPWVQELFGGNTPAVKDGYAELPSHPGLGVTLNEKVAAEHPYKPTNRPEYKFGDGSVTDQ